MLGRVVVFLLIVPVFLNSLQGESFALETINPNSPNKENSYANKEEDIEKIPQSKPTIPIKAKSVLEFLGLKGPVKEYHVKFIIRDSQCLKKYISGGRKTLFNRDGTTLRESSYILPFTDLGEPILEKMYENKFVYAQEGFEVESFHYDGKGNLQSRNVGVKDEFGREINVFSYNKEGKLISRTIHVYDPNGKIKKGTYEVDGVTTLTFIYDSEGRVMKQHVHITVPSNSPFSTLVPSSFFHLTIFTYEDSQTTKEVYDSLRWDTFDGIARKTVSFYDTNHLMIKSEDFKDNVLTERRKYEYKDPDQYGNYGEEVTKTWRFQPQYYEGCSSTESQIVYYESP